MSKIYIVGIGPGGKEHITNAALNAIDESSVVIGYSTYISFIDHLLTNKRVEQNGMKKEVERCKLALDIANEGNIVSLVSGGDAGVYGMAGIMLEVANSENSAIEIEVVPAVSAVNAAAACLGAPVMHDFAVISLSDLLTPWELIEKRLECAGMGDFIVALYNPKSQKRDWQIQKAMEILLKYKKPQTPVGIVRNAKREGENVVITTLAEMCNSEIDMFTVVIIGNNQTYIENGKIITPRGYKLWF